jgi:hypothetical protein
MGNITGKNNNNDVSSTIPYLNKINEQARLLVKNINPPETSELLFSETDNYEKYKVFEQNNNINNNDNLSETSPFITEEFYNKIMKGGAGDDSSSSTSSSENKTANQKNMSDDLDDDEVKKELSELKKPKKNKKSKNNESSDETEESDESNDSEDLSELEEMTTGSYLSSSAHTDGINSNSSEVSTISIGNKKYVSDSVNTSDINMISIDD